jgi:protein SCO1/2
MMNSKPKIKGLYISILVLFFLSVSALIVLDLANKSRSDLPLLGDVPKFQFTERSGSAFGNNNMQGMINIVNFFFTTCQGPCPIMNARVAELYNQYSTTDQVRFVSISVDPKRDSLAVLRKYADDFGVTDNRWVFLRGEIEEVHRVSEKGFMLAGELPIIHSTKLILVDKNQKIRGYYDSFDEESLRLLTVHVRELLHGDSF